MKRLVFIDDDRSELADCGEIIGNAYDYIPVHWPSESAKLFNGPVPDIVVSDLYLPPESGDSEPKESQREEAIRSLNDVTARFSEAAANRNLSDKERIRKTIQAISEAYGALQLQWVALGHSPSHGIALLGKLRSLFPSVPVVFYSRKITPEDVIAVLQAGAVDAIGKGTLKPQELLARLKLAQSREHPANPLIR